jgi:hypothetical protein
VCRVGEAESDSANPRGRYANCRLSEVRVFTRAMVIGQGIGSYGIGRTLPKLFDSRAGESLLRSRQMPGNRSEVFIEADRIRGRRRANAPDRGQPGLRSELVKRQAENRSDLGDRAEIGVAALVALDPLEHRGVNPGPTGDRGLRKAFRLAASPDCRSNAF